jgi:hypothetical protein
MIIPLKSAADSPTPYGCNQCSHERTWAENDGAKPNIALAFRSIHHRVLFTAEIGMLTLIFLPYSLAALLDPVSPQNRGARYPYIP